MHARDLQKLGYTKRQTSERVCWKCIPFLPQPFALARTTKSSSLILPGAVTMTTNVNSDGGIVAIRDNRALIGRRQGIVIVQNNRTIWSMTRNVSGLASWQRQQRLLSFKTLMVTCLSTFFCNFKALLTTFTFIQSDVIKRRQRVNNSAVFCAFNHFPVRGSN